MTVYVTVSLGPAGVVGRRQLVGGGGETRGEGAMGMVVGRPLLPVGLRRPPAH